VRSLLQGLAYHRRSFDVKTRQGVLATGSRPAPLILPIVSSAKTSRGFMQRHRPYGIGDIGAAFCDRTVAITTITHHHRMGHGDQPHKH
jgi:hypothetical protein